MRKWSYFLSLSHFWIIFGKILIFANFYYVKLEFKLKMAGPAGKLVVKFWNLFSGLLIYRGNTYYLDRKFWGLFLKTGHPSFHDRVGCYAYTTLQLYGLILSDGTTLILIIFLYISDWRASYRPLGLLLLTLKLLLNIL